MRGAIAAAIVSTVIASTAAARADEPAETKPDNRARAQQLFDSALADAEAGKFGAACPKFLASQEADPKTSTLLNLANCYEKNGQTASAWGAFREAEVLARKAGRSDWESIARTRADAIEPKLVRLSIALPPASRVEGIVVTRDGARIAAGEWGVAIPVDPGEHIIAASAEGRLPWETRVTVTQDNVTVEVPVLDSVPAPAPPPPLPPAPVPNADRASSPGWSTEKTTGVILAGAGAGGLVAGTILGLVAKSNYDDARGQCRDGARGCPGGAVDDADGAYGLATGATVIFVVGAVLLAGGATLFVLAPDGKRATSTTPNVPSPGVAMSPKGLRLTW